MKFVIRYLRFSPFIGILSLVLILLGAGWVRTAQAQNTAESGNGETAATTQARIERARALAAAHQLTAAAAELESLRVTAQDNSIRNVASVMLMSICLEEGNYARAESLLEETFKAREARKDASIRTYFVLAGQAVNGARSHLTRYRNFGINVTDETLPKEALNDLDRLRSLLERMSFQAREIIKGQPRAYESLALLEDILGIRLSLARNAEDRSNWEGDLANVRQGLIVSQSQVASLGTIPTVTAVLENSNQLKTETASSTTESQPQPSAESSKPSDPNLVTTGLLNQRATKRVVPVYPQIARSSSAQGIVRVYVTIDEQGNVSEIAKTEGPSLLRGAAEDAAKRWKFSPTAVRGQAVRLFGFIEFNFTL